MPSSSRLALRRRDLEMRVENGAKFIRRHEAGDKLRRRPGRNRQNEAVGLAKVDDVLAEVETRRAIPGEVDPAQPRAETHIDAEFSQLFQGGVDKGRPKPVLGHHRPASGAAGGEGLAQHGAGERRRWPRAAPC